MNSIKDRISSFDRFPGAQLKSLLQTEAAECGLACLTMIARYHGHDVDLASLRRLYPTSIQGANLSQVIKMAQKLGLVARPVRIELDDVRKLECPAILHWDLNHVVVLKSVRSKKVVICDPAQGERTLTYRELSDHFTGVALAITRQTDFSKISTRSQFSVSSLTGTVVGLRQNVAILIALALIIEGFTLASPFYVKIILDRVVLSGNLELLNIIAVCFLLALSFQVAVMALRNWILTWLGIVLNLQWGNNLFTHMLNLPLDFFQKRHIGDIVSKFSSVTSIQQTLTTNFVTALLDGAMSVFTVVAVGLLDWRLAAIMTSFLALYAAVRWAGYGLLNRVSDERIAYGSRQQSELLESIRGIQTIKVYNKQAHRITRYFNTSVDTANRNITVQRIAVVYAALSGLLFGVESIVATWFAATLVLAGQISSGILVAFASYLVLFNGRIVSVIDKLIEFRTLKLHVDRISDIALCAPEPRALSTYSGSISKYSVEMRNVSFRYSPRDPWVLRNFSMTVAAGESVALTGPSGCGKTTIAKLLLGLLEPTEGAIRIGGVNIVNFGLDNYRDLTSSVMQDDHLFAGSLADNISFFDDSATLDAIQAAARLASIHEEILAMPMGYETLVGDMGSSLSGGQRQRILLARALYRKPKFLILDEATSHLDVARERQVNAAIGELAITRIVIAHRPETIASAQRVMEVKKADSVKSTADSTIAHAEI